MLTLYDRGATKQRPPADLTGADLPEDVVWLDLIEPDPDEVRFVHRTTGLTVPTIEGLNEIESSSRMRHRNGAFYLSLPLVSRADSDEAMTSPVGFVLTRERLVTVRFAEFKSFTQYAEHELGEQREVASVDVFAGLMDAIADRVADILENIADELDVLSHRLFHSPVAEPGKRQPPAARESADLRLILRRVGHSGDLASKIRDSLHGLARIVPYVLGLTTDWLPTEVRTELETVRQDVLSLVDYDAHIVNKVQLLLDATLGLINTEQNNIIKVLTIVSVVGIPPTLIASMYGMNFKYIPEYDWGWGYPYGLAVIALSAILPLVIFKLRGWI